MDTTLDTRMMARAMQLAHRGRYSCMPNPHVGCVLVRDGNVIGEGTTCPPGGNHAEIEALQAAGDAAGATAYVTLEPCSHQGRTGPCADALVDAGIVRVVAAMQDPNPQVAGGGLSKLREAGVLVECGLLESEARRVIPGYTARADVQRLRAMSCAVVTGVGTVLADDCSLTVRGDFADTRQPLRVVLDSQLQTPADSKVFSAEAATLICHDEQVSVPSGLAGLEAEFAALPRDDDGLDLGALMDQLSARHCNEILVESGPRLAGALLRQGLLDELIVYMAPALLGSNARPLLELPLEQMAGKVQLEVTDLRQVGDDYRFTVVPRAADN
jgi:diaminohydroxyphosphoribosylaminopyrimidine deaminase/5-amino-6-(5-phosphoribosylamino)uracil reductase